MQVNTIITEWNKPSSVPTEQSKAQINEFGLFHKDELLTGGLLLTIIPSRKDVLTEGACSEYRVYADPKNRGDVVVYGFCGNGFWQLLGNFLLYVVMALVKDRVTNDGDLPKWVREWLDE